jgi:hypothetical protein
MNRREFLTISSTASLAAVTGTASAAEASSEREYYDLKQFIIENADQKKKVDAFLKNAAIPALNRLGMKPVGVFYPAEGLSPIYVLLRHPSPESVCTLNARLGEDSEFLSQGAELLDAPVSAPAFKRMENSLMIAFRGMPQMATPAQGPARVFQLRTYESPSVKTNLKKIEMFNDAGEIKLFREVGLTPVFFGQTLVGTKMPNLTYMLGFNTLDDQKVAWKKFGAHPEWKKLSAMPEYADKNILCGITNLSLVPAEYSQV